MLFGYGMDKYNRKQQMLLLMKLLKLVEKWGKFLKGLFMKKSLRVHDSAINRASIWSKHRKGSRSK